MFRTDYVGLQASLEIQFRPLQSDNCTVNER